MYEPNVVELARIKYRVLNLLPFSSMMSVSTLLLYLAYRAKSIVTAYNINADLSATFNSSLYFIAELGLLCKYCARPVHPGI